MRKLEQRALRLVVVARSEVMDPYGSDLASYRTTFAELQEMIGAVVSRVAGMVR